MDLQNKVVIITGASDGIGKQIALTLAKKGTKLALIARNQEKLDATVLQALELGAADAKAYSCDISILEKLETTLETVVADYGVVDVLINNAGIWQKMMPIDEVTGEQADAIIMTNMSAVIHSTRVLLPYLRKQDEAAIINVSSKSGVTFQGGQSVYTATKHGVRGFTDVLKEDLKETNVRVAGVYQAGTNTSMFANTGETMPIEKFTDPADLANVIIQS